MYPPARPRPCSSRVPRGFKVRLARDHALLPVGHRIRVPLAPLVVPPHGSVVSGVSESAVLPRAAVGHPVVAAWLCGDLGSVPELVHLDNLAGGSKLRTGGRNGGGSRLHGGGRGGSRSGLLLCGSSLRND